MRKKEPVVLDQDDTALLLLAAVSYAHCLKDKDPKKISLRLMVDWISDVAAGGGISIQRIAEYLPAKKRRGKKS